MVGLGARVIGKEIVDAKLLAAAPRILEQNQLMVRGFLDYIKPIVQTETPVGPGHFGYHLRDMFEIDVKSEAFKTVGVLKSPPTGYWREYGTLGHARIATVGAHRRVLHLTAKEARMAFEVGNLAGVGERAFMTAHKAASGVQRLIKFYYGGLAAWWRP